MPFIYLCNSLFLLLQCYWLFNICLSYFYNRLSHMPFYIVLFYPLTILFLNCFSPILYGTRVLHKMINFNIFLPTFTVSSIFSLYVKFLFLFVSIRQGVYVDPFMESILNCMLLSLLPIVLSANKVSFSFYLINNNMVGWVGICFW